MTETDAIKIFKKLLCVPKDMIVKYDSVTNKEQKEALEKVYQAQQLAIAALVKQDAKEPVHHDNCGNPTLYTTRCPKCFEIVEKSHLGNVSWCRHCGQKISWE